MPSAARLLTLDAARERIRERSLATTTDVPAPDGGAPPRRVGLEAEWHIRPVADPAADVRFDDLRDWTAPAASLPGGCGLSWEPGGQLELSSPPADGVQAAIDLLAADAAVV